MRVVQALHWMQDMLAQDSERKRTATQLRTMRTASCRARMRHAPGPPAPENPTTSTSWPNRESPTVLGLVC